MADRSVVAWNELYESEASSASVFCFYNDSEKYCFVGSLVCFMSSRFCVPECHQKGVTSSTGKKVPF